MKHYIEMGYVADKIFETRLEDVFAGFGQEYLEYKSISMESSYFQFLAQKLYKKYKKSYSTAINEICQAITNDENFHVIYTKVQEKQKKIDELVITKLADNDLIQKHEAAFKQNIWLLQIEILQKYKTKKIVELSECNKRILQQVLTFELSQISSDEAKKEALNMKLAFLDEFLMENPQNQNTMNPRSDKAHDLSSCDVILEKWIPNVSTKSLIGYQQAYFNYMKNPSIYDESSAQEYAVLKSEIYEIISMCFCTAMNEYSKE